MPGVKPYRGVLTGFNEAFLVDTPTRDRLVAADPASAEIIKPYLRGQDVQRWSAPYGGLHMILLKSSSDFAWPWADTPDETAAESVFAKTYPALHARMKRYESLPGDKPNQVKGLRHRQDHGRFWWELRPCAYYDAFERPKTSYQEIQFYPSYSADLNGRYGNNKTFFIPNTELYLLAVLNSPLLWWHNWRFLPHMKDEALTPVAFRMELLPIASGSAEAKDTISADVDRLIAVSANLRATTTAIHDWLRLEFGLDLPGRLLERPERLDADGFASAVRAALPRRRQLSAAEIARLKREHVQTGSPAREAAAEALRLERRLSDLVNAAYGLTPEDVALMWSSAPPRMPVRRASSRVISLVNAIGRAGTSEMLVRSCHQNRRSSPATETRSTVWGRISGP